MRKLLTLSLLSLSLSGCITITPDHNEDDAPQEASAPVRTRTVVREVGCPAMPQVRLAQVPAPPRNAVASATSHTQLDSVLNRYIAQLQQVIRNNNQAVRSAIQRNNSRCKR